MKQKILLSLLLMVSAILTACSDTDNNKTDNEEEIVYTSVYPLMFLAEQIGGEHVNVKSVYPAGADEHTFEPSQKDLIKMAGADLFLYIGYNLEGFITKAAPILKNEGVEMAAIGERLNIEDSESHAEEKDDHEGHDHGDVDPHIWLDPDLMMKMAKEVKKELINLKPEQTAEFEENYEQVSQKLQKLDEQFADTVAKANKKEIIVSHAAYGYWESKYGIEQIAVAGLSSSSEPTQKQLKNIMEIAKDKNIEYVLFEQNITSKLTETIQKEIGAKPLYLHNLSVLTEDDLKNNVDYFSIMENNLSTLEKALQ